MTITFSHRSLGRIGAVLGLAVLTSACVASGPRTAPVATAPAPLTPAPTTAVQAASLPPVEEETPAALEPVAPVSVASVGTSAVNAETLGGGWTIASGGAPCALFLSRTAWTGGQRASTRGCASPDLSRVQAWAYEGGRVVLKDGTGGEIARLSASSAGAMSGATVGGAGVSANRAI
ncbi:MAG: AprI/Inh family metalloprotease inhibitor [Pseudomonadota bacterium]